MKRYKHTNSRRTCRCGGSTVKINICSICSLIRSGQSNLTLCHKAASPQQTGGSIVFARWRQYPHEGTLAPPGKYD